MSALIISILLLALVVLLLWAGLSKSRGPAESFRLDRSQPPEQVAQSVVAEPNPALTDSALFEVPDLRSSTGYDAYETKIPEVPKPWRFPLLAKHPSLIAFIDVETTGLQKRDRVVTLAVALVEAGKFEQGNVEFHYLHRIYNPGIACHPQAERVHGHTDWTLRHQPFFSEEAKEVVAFISRADLLCCHNADFDIPFLNREFSHCGIPDLCIPAFCTMTASQALLPGSASLASQCARLGLKRKSSRHDGFEDVIFTMALFHKLNGIPIRFSTWEDVKLQNLRPVPPFPKGKLPPRKRRPKGVNMNAVD